MLDSKVLLTDTLTTLEARAQGPGLAQGQGLGPDDHSQHEGMSHYDSQEQGLAQPFVKESASSLPLLLAVCADFCGLNTRSLGNEWTPSVFI